MGAFKNGLGSKLFGAVVFYQPDGFGYGHRCLHTFDGFDVGHHFAVMANVLLLEEFGVLHAQHQHIAVFAKLLLKRHVLQVARIIDGYGFGKLVAHLHLHGFVGHKSRAAQQRHQERHFVFKYKSCNTKPHKSK